MITVYEREQKVNTGALVKIAGTAEEGAYTAHYCESNEDVIITIEQANITLYYTKKYRLQNEDVDNKYTKHFLLPIVIESDTGKIIDIIWKCISVFKKELSSKDSIFRDIFDMIRQMSNNKKFNKTLKIKRNKIWKLRIWT